MCSLSFGVGCSVGQRSGIRVSRPRLDRARRSILACHVINLTGQILPVTEFKRWRGCVVGLAYRARLRLARHGRGLFRKRRSFLWAALLPQRKSRTLDGDPYSVQVHDRLVANFPREENGEFLAAIPVCFAASEHVAQFTSDELEDLVTHVMSMPVVELLEVVHVYHRASVELI